MSTHLKEYHELLHCRTSTLKVSDCCLTPTLQFFSYIMARTS